MADIEITSTGVSETDIYLNTVLQGQINPLNQIDVNLEDSLGNLVTPISSNLTGNTLDIVTYPAPSGVALDFPKPYNYASYVTGDTGWRLQNGWFNYVPPTNPAKYAELDYSIGANFFYKLKTALTVNGVTSTTRFVNVTGVQDWPNTTAQGVIIDKLTGCMITRNVYSDANQANTIAAALSYSITISSVTYDDWYLIGFNEATKILGTYPKVGAAGGGGAAWIDPITGAYIQYYMPSSTSGWTADRSLYNTVEAQDFIINTLGLKYNATGNSFGNHPYRWYIRNCTNLIS